MAALTKNKPFEVVTRADPQFYQLSTVLSTSDDIGAIVILPVQTRGILLMIYDGNFDINNWQKIGRMQVHFLVEQLSRVLVQEKSQKKLAKGYARVLCHLADTIDNLNPYTIGYSEMMARYSPVIGKNSGCQMTNFRIWHWLPT